jgi:malonate decarboxylase beta subunit
VIEQEAGIAEYDSRDRPFIWSLTGGEQRYATGLVDRFVDDDARDPRRRGRAGQCLGATRVRCARAASGTTITCNASPAMRRTARRSRSTPPRRSILGERQ